MQGMRGFQYEKDAFRAFLAVRGAQEQFPRRRGHRVLRIVAHGCFVCRPRKLLRKKSVDVAPVSLTR